MKRIIVLLWLFIAVCVCSTAQDLTIGPGMSFTISNSITYSNITINGGALTIAGTGVNVTAQNLSLQGTTSNMGVISVSGSTLTIINSCYIQNTHNTSITLSDNALMQTKGLTTGATVPSVCMVRINSGATLSASEGWAVETGSDVKIMNGFASCSTMVVSEAIFEVAGINSLVTSGRVNINQYADVRVFSGATFLSTDDVNINGNSFTRLELKGGGKFEVGKELNTSNGKIFSDGHSQLIVKQDFNNGIGMDLYPAGSTVNLVMEGSHAGQEMNGIHRLSELIIRGNNGNVLLDNEVYITSQLVLADSRMLHVNGLLSIENTAAAAIVKQSSGYIYVLHNNTSRLIRRTASTSEYFFPIGSETLYRPVYIKPASSSAGAYSVRCAERMPYIGLSNIGSSIIASNIIANGSILPRKRVNNLYLHEIRDESVSANSPQAALYIGYDPVVDESYYDAIAQYLSGSWQALQIPVAKIAQGNIAFAGVSSHQITEDNIDYILCNSIESTIAPSYAQLKKRLDGGYYQTITNHIYFRFEEEYSILSPTLQYTIYSAHNNQAIPFSSLPVVRGTNEYALNVSSLSSGYYVLEVNNTKKEKWYLRFSK
jgi:hypothetical protein